MQCRATMSVVFDSEDPFKALDEAREIFRQAIMPMDQKYVRHLMGVPTHPATAGVMIVVTDIDPNSPHNQP
jgi:hypothetical protein